MVADWASPDYRISIFRIVRLTLTTINSLPAAAPLVRRFRVYVTTVLTDALLLAGFGSGVLEVATALSTIVPEPNAAS
jgi:hypothetical protein